MLDHLLALTFAVGFPAVATPLYAARKPRLLAGDAQARLREYRESIAWLAGMGVATLALWAMKDRPWDWLGLGVPAPGWAWLALASSAVLSGLFAWQARGILRDEKALAGACEALEPVREYLPTNDQEARLFRGVALSTGIGEEIFYRGFLLWYLSQFMPMLLAVAVSSALFGLAHLMHGVQATIRAMITGILLAGLYLLGGTLFAPMLVHAVIDLTNGAVGRAALGAERYARSVGRNL